MFKRRTYAIAVFLLSISIGGSAADSSSSPPDAVVYIVSPKNGAIVSNPVTVVFGLKGMGVVPAGIDKAGTGHHHLLVDYEKLPPLDKPLGQNVRHFGKGQTQTTLELSPGAHTLQLILGNHLHVPHDPPVISERITINVE